MSLSVRCHFVPTLGAFLLTLVLFTVSGTNPAYGDDFTSAIERRWPIEQAFNIRDGYARIVTIRVIPGQSVDPETYVVLRIRSNGSTDLEYAVPQKESLFAQARRLSANGSTTEQIARDLAISTTRIKDSQQARRRAANFGKVQMAVLLPDALYLDSTRIDISETTPMNRLTVSVYDSTALPENALLRWAKRVVRESAKLVSSR